MKKKIAIFEYNAKIAKNGQNWEIIKKLLAGKN